MNHKIIHLFSIAILILVSSILLNGQAINSSNQKDLGTKRNAHYNIEEIKVRWKKAALENCPGVPCVVPPSPPTSFTCGTSTISDIDGNTYNTVLIGTQCWTKENLKVTKYNDGTTIPLDASGGSNGGGSGQTWSARNEGAYSIYANVSSSDANATNYGFLYNGFAATGIITSGGTPTKNICPSGWHVPSETEWDILINYAGGTSIAGGKLKSSNLWTVFSPPSPGTDDYGFSALPGGERAHGGGVYEVIRESAFFWSSTIRVTTFGSLSFTDGRFIGLNYQNNNISKLGNIRRKGLSIRCLKD